jgi:hypothetical protein
MWRGGPVQSEETTFAAFYGLMQDCGKLVQMEITCVVSGPAVCVGQCGERLTEENQVNHEGFKRPLQLSDIRRDMLCSIALVIEICSTHFIALRFQLEELQDVTCQASCAALCLLIPPPGLLESQNRMCPAKADKSMFTLKNVDGVCNLCWPP